jgi:hypothetical protein
MPSRWTSLCIVAFWLAATGWLFWRDVWPQVRPGEPPPFVVDLTEETQAEHPRVRWKVFQDGVERFYARTWVTYREADDTFALLGELKPSDPTAKGKDGLSLLGLKIERINSLCRITRRGDLKALEAALTLPEGFPGIDLSPYKSLTNPDVKGRVLVGGSVHDGLFRPAVRVEIVRDEKKVIEDGLIEEAYVEARLRQLDLNPVAVPDNGAVLLPMQPVNRIRGLRTGKSWRVPLFNPLASALSSNTLSAALGRNAGPPTTYLNARVLDRIDQIPFEGLDRPCFVVEYEGEDARARTWVEIGTESRVLQQEATLDGQTLRLVRDSTKSAVRR